MFGQHKGMLKTFQRVSLKQLARIGYKYSNTMLRTKKTLLFIALGVMFAQGVILLTPKVASAAEDQIESIDGGNGACYPVNDHICGLNGQNYPDKAYSGN